MDYGKTLNLPQTEFPMRGNLPKAEPEMQAWWDEQNIYAKVQEHRQGSPTFILHDGPPYANGDIHIGHALNKILKDFIVRYKTMQGYAAPYVPGWDTHGLPIEQAIANKGKVDRKKMPVSTFRQYCKEYALDWVEKQKSQFKRLSIRGDWERPYLTLDASFVAQQIRLFGEMVSKGYIYKGLRPVYWSPSSESAMAEAEIEYLDKRSPSIYVAFDVKEGKGRLPVGAKVMIWTTTPWTLPANLGISLHPEYDYVLVEVAGDLFVIAEGLLAEVTQVLGWEQEQVELLERMKGAELDGVICQHPFYDRESLVMVGEHVTLDSGTGCVHTAPGHGEDDFVIGNKYGLDVLCPVDDYGKFTEEAPGFEGMFYDKANKEITEKLKETGHLLHLSFIDHQYPHDWRTRKPVIFRATEQWFASVDPFREKMLEEIQRIQWTPSWGETRLHNMIADRGDWCISRQRTWGVPIPIFYCEACHEPLINEDTIAHVADLFEREGANVWFEREASELLPNGEQCSKCEHAQFRKETDTMDVWFDSGSTHVGVLEAREDLSWPADLYLEGSDQYRGWFNSSLITSVAVRGQAPYKQILSHGFTLDGEGRKMSKSIGNTVDPVKVSNSLGADILRLWVASVDYQADVRISDNILRQTSEAYRKIRNTLRFLLGNLSDFTPGQDDVEFAQLNELDRFAIIRLNRMIERVLHAYEKYDFHVVYQTIHHFCAVEMSAFYLDIVKDRLYVTRADDEGRKAAQTVLYESLAAVVRLIAPILPHTSEEVWKFVPGKEQWSVQLADMPQADASKYDEALEQKWAALIAVRDEVNKALEEARKNKTIGNSLVAKLDLYPDEKTLHLLEQLDDVDLETLFIVSKVELHPNEVPEEARNFVGLSVQVTPAAGEKCDRCWMISPNLGTNSAHPDLCLRCTEVVVSLEN